MKIVAAFAVTAALLSGCTGGAGHAEPAASSAPAANGITDLPAAAILARARATLTGAKSFHIRGGLTSGADGYHARLWMMDVRLAGDDSAGWTAEGDKKQLTLSGARQDTLTVAGLHYLRPSEQLLAEQMGPVGARQFVEAQAGRWITIPPKHGIYGDFVTTAWVLSLLEPDGAVTKGAVKTFSGVPAVAVTYGDGDARTTVYVATVGMPYPIRLDHTDAEAVSFTEFGATFGEIAAPAPTEVIDLAEVQKKSEQRLLARGQRS